MRLAVLDTNVIVSAGIQPDGPSGILMTDWVLDGRVQTVTCPWIVGEYRLVMRRKKFSAYRFPPSWLDFFIEESLHLPDPGPWNGPIPDPKDAPFLALAAHSGAWLITGNLKHFPRNVRAGVTAMSPADYLAHLCS